MKIKIMMLATALALASGCTSLENKAFGAAGAVDAAKIETAGGATTGTLLPNVTFGGAVSAIGTSPAAEEGKSFAPVIVRSVRNSFFGELFGLNCNTEALVYIGTPGESSADTQARLNAVMTQKSPTK